jgi:hypothetical protein
VDAESGRASARTEAGTSPERKASSRGRGESGSPARGTPPRPADDSRRKRSSAPRFATWSDGIERAYCLRARHILPTTFPVASHAGVATIPATIVARREDALLLCTFDHLGPHVWPDGEVVDERQSGSGLADESG